MLQSIEDCDEEQIWDGSNEVCIKSDYRHKIGDGNMPNRYWVGYYNSEYVCKKQDDGSTFCDHDESIEGEGGIIAVFDSFYDAVEFAEGFRDMEDPIKIKGRSFDITNKSIEDRLVGQVWEEGTYNYEYVEVMKRREYETHSEERWLRQAMNEKNAIFR